MKRSAAKKTPAPVKGTGVFLFLRALLAGALLATSLSRFVLGFLAWFALAPLFFSLEKPSRGKAFGVGLAGGTGFHAVALYWTYTAFRLSGCGWALSGAILLATALFGGALWGLLWLAGERPIARLPAAVRPWAWAVLWTAGMAAVERWAPWPCISLLAYTQYLNPRMMQVVSLFGPHVLGFLIIAVNVAVAQVWQARRLAGSNRTNLAVLAVLLSAVWLYGWKSLSGRPEPRETMRIEILHPEVDPRGRWDEAYVASIENNFEDILLRPRAKDPAMIFWHEGSIPRWLRQDDAVHEASRWSRRLRAYQLVGAYSIEDGAYYNSVFAFSPDGEPAGRYHQRVLIPLLERMPDSRLIRRLLGTGSNPLAVPVSAGDARQALFATPLGPAGIGICFESMFPRIARADAARGARFLFEASNDAWFPGTWEPEQHLMVNILRAVENRAVVVRASNGGVAAVIDPWGTVVARLEPSRRGRLDVDVDVRDAFPGRSFYTRHGDVLGTLCMALAAAFLALG